MVRVGLFILITLATFSHANSNNIEDQNSVLTLHADNAFLTERVNLDNKPYSTSVDTVQMLVDEIGYKDPVLHVPVVRSFAYMEHGENICVLNKIKAPEREKNHLYSLPLSFFQTQRFYQLASLPPIEKEFLDDKGRILSISRVIEAFPDSFIVLPEEYSFGERVDDDLKQVSREQILHVANNIYYSRFMEMFAKGKSDFALIFPATLYRNFGENMPIRVRSYSIADNPDYVTGHVICPDTAQGAKHIERINAAIKRIYLTPAFVHAHTRYLPAQDKQNLRTIIKQSIEKLMLAD
ncbi:hypothetical protein BM523_13270 [Alteromonas mediterranea]|uniref:hypothetical protein n=1 Tax=Alteromonas mediterranea TaxID=314275 RepID=UPI00090429A7|nr:hypothetical protein [Alteromonas mediterranea]APD94900.1 hypothetical protein BM523_13270 [Alteromonas mediterranea]APD98535.1 hypothetical protein BM525_13350 [Alteromonas mediterranea]